MPKKKLKEEVGDEKGLEEEYEDFPEDDLDLEDGVLADDGDI